MALRVTLQRSDTESFPYSLGPMEPTPHGWGAEGLLSASVSGNHYCSAL